jgi:hypothetical protein
MPVAARAQAADGSRRGRNRLHISGAIAGRDTDIVADPSRRPTPPQLTFAGLSAGPHNVIRNYT